MIKAAIFDVDGVLLDTVPYHFSAWQEMFREEGIDHSFNDYLSKVNGLPRINGITNILGNRSKEELEILAEKKQKYYLKKVGENPPKPLEGVVDLFKSLINNNVILAAASSSKNAPLLIEKANLSQYLKVIIGGNDFKNPKPDPDIFLTASKKLKIKPEFCVVFEDAYLGIQAGKKAGMKTIGVLTSHDQEIPKIADVTFNSFENYQEIINYIKGL